MDRCRAGARETADRPLPLYRQPKCKAIAGSGRKRVLCRHASYNACAQTLTPHHDGPVAARQRTQDRTRIGEERLLRLGSRYCPNSRDGSRAQRRSLPGGAFRRRPKNLRKRASVAAKENDRGFSLVGGPLSQTRSRVPSFSLTVRSIEPEGGALSCHQRARTKTMSRCQ